MEDKWKQVGHPACPHCRHKLDHLFGKYRQSIFTEIITYSFDNEENRFREIDSEIDDFVDVFEYEDFYYCPYCDEEISWEYLRRYMEEL